MIKRLAEGKLVSGLVGITVLILAVIPFHAFLTVWLSSLVGHYTALRLWKEALLFLLILGGLWILAQDKLLRQKFIHWRVSQLIVAYSLLSIAWGFTAYGLHKVTAKALGYGLVVNLRFLAFFLAVWVIAAKTDRLRRPWRKLLLWPAAIVIIFAILQELVLPYNFLGHFGYNSHTILPYQTINLNLNYLRVFSTLRGANPLGAYLVVITSALAVMWLRHKIHRRWLGLFGLAALAALAFSYSRAAWLGLGLGLFFLAVVSIKNNAARRNVLVVASLVIAIGGASTLALRNNTTFQNLFFHTQNHAASSVSPNQQHASDLRSGLHDVAHQPLGQGVGTAGPASVYNSKPRIAENYFIQIAQETGWLGLALLIAIGYLVAAGLWARRADELALSLLVSFVGLIVVACFSHAWTDDTLAYLWWGLAGIALAPGILKPEGKNGQTRVAKT